jgi:hypothetical protein
MSGRFVSHGAAGVVLRRRAQYQPQPRRGRSQNTLRREKPANISAREREQLFHPPTPNIWARRWENPRWIADRDDLPCTANRQRLRQFLDIVTTRTLKTARSAANR